MVLVMDAEKWDICAGIVHYLKVNKRSRKKARKGQEREIERKPGEATETDTVKEEMGEMPQQTKDQDSRRT